MATLREAAKKKVSGKGQKAELNHPTLDNAEAAARPLYVPPQPKDRFKFLKTFATIPGLRSRGAAQTPQG